MQLITRKEAIEKKLTNYFTGKPCKHGHIAPRNVKSKGCVECRKRDSYKCVESRRKASRKQHYKNRDKRRAQMRDLYQKKTERYKELANNYRARKLQAMPNWLSDDHLDAIHDLYRESERISQATGITHHVDHIVPLKGENVCGLHVPWNLQILTEDENRAKTNKFDPNVDIDLLINSAPTTNRLVA